MMANGFCFRLDGSGDGVFAVDAGGSIIYWSKGAEDILGWPAEEVLHKPCWQVVRGSTSAGKPFCGPTCPLMRRTGEPPRNFDLEVFRMDRSRRWVNISIVYGAEHHPDQGGATNTPAVLHLLHDVTQRQQMEGFACRVLEMSESLRATPRIVRMPEGRRALRLSPRQQSVLELMAQGLATVAMAREMKVRVSTVRTHVEQLMKALGAHSRLQAVHIARRQGLLP